jgi:hypothetical protein
MRIPRRAALSTTMMFCGLPISVQAEPMLAAQASASGYGAGSSRRFSRALIQHRRDSEFATHAWLCSATTRSTFA